MDSSEYIKVDVNTFRNAGKNIEFDVFIKLGEKNYAHVFSKVSGVDFQRLSHYQEKGVQYLFIRKEDESVFKQYIQARPETVIQDPHASATKKAAALLNIADKNLSDVFATISKSIPLSDDQVSGSSVLIKNFVKLMTSDPKSLTLMIRVASHGDYLYYHSIFVSVVSMFIAKAAVGGNAKMLEVCGLGGLLHDIGYAQLPRDLLESPNALTPAQWREMRKHNQYAVQMVEGLKDIPDEVRFILAQHHEEPRGTGYPAGIRGPVIFYPAKIVSLADGFCALVSRRPFRPAFSVEQALNIIKHENGKWDADLIKILCQIFKPGSNKLAA